MTLSNSKQHIAQSIKDGIKDNHLSLRRLADRIDGLSYTQIARMTTGKNYNIDTLLKVLDVLNLELTIKTKS